jgi:calcineurin-like phosphoesterase family protein
MTKTWVIADTHFGHQGVCNFIGKDGITPLRPWDNASEMDGALIQNWNDTVGHNDRVYVLGDVAMVKKNLWPLAVLNGRKVLVKGNHDVEKLNAYRDIFDDVRAYVVKKGLIMSHIPIHPASLSRWQFNIHGHLHDGFVKLPGSDEPDPRYICVSVERTNYRPVDLQTIINRLDANFVPNFQ